MINPRSNHFSWSYPKHCTFWHSQRLTMVTFNGKLFTHRLLIVHFRLMVLMETSTGAHALQCRMVESICGMYRLLHWPKQYRFLMYLGWHPSRSMTSLYPATLQESLNLHSGAGISTWKLKCLDSRRSVDPRSKFPMHSIIHISVN